MSLPLVFQAGVRDEIDEAYAWYDERREGLGEDFLTALQRALDRVEELPELHAPVHKAVRRAPVQRFPYAIYYRIEPERIAVLAVHHAKRDPRIWQSRA